MASQKTTKKDLLKAEEQPQGSAVDRVTSLPLLNSAFNLVSSAYTYTKETHPCLSGVCSVAETVAAVAVGSVVGGAQPILNQLEPQIALVNEYACKGLDQLEENLPFLQQPADKVISDTKQLVSTKVTSAMDAACEAKEAMANKVTEAVDLTKNVVGDSVKLTRSVVTSTINSAVEAAHGAKDLVTTKVTEAVDLTKHMVEDSIEQTKSAVASTIVNAVEAAQGAKDLVTTKVTTKVTEAVEAAHGAKDLVTTKVTEAVDLTKHMVEDSIEQTKSAVASTIVNAVEAAQGAKDIVANKVTTKVTEAVEAAQGAKDLVTTKVTTKVTEAVEAAQGAKDLVTTKVTEAVDLSKHMVEDSIEQTKSAVASTIVSAVEAAQGAKDIVANKVTTKVTEAVEAAQGAKDLVTNKVTEAVDFSKHIVEDSVERTKSAVASTIVNAVEAAQGAKDLVTNKVTEAVDLSKHMVEDSVGRTKSAVSSTITAAVEAAQGAKDLVTNKVTEAMDLTKGAVQDSVEKTKSAVTSTVSTALDAAYGTVTSKINTALEQGKEALQEGVEMTNLVVTNSISKAKAVSQAVGGGVEAVLGMSEDLVDHYLPMTDEELGKLATSEGLGMASVEEQRQNKSYFVRLGSLSNKVRRRAYHLSLHKLQRLRQSTQETLSRLQLAIKLIDSVKGQVGQKLLDGQEKLYQLWLDWSLTQPKGNQVKTASQVEVESRTLTMLHIITRQLQPAFETLKESIQGLPSSIQEAVYKATQNIHQLHRSFSSAVSFQDLSSTTLAQSQDWVAEARRSLDVLLEYVTQNTPLNWVVGPFRAVANVTQGSRKQKKKDLVPPIKSPVLDRAPSSKEGAKTPKEPKGAQEILGEVCEVLAKLGSRKQKKKDLVPPIKSPVLDRALSSKEGAKTPKEPKGAQEILGEGHEVLEKLEEKAEKDTEVALPAKEVETKAPEADL